jgi:histidine ammonia-lyase
MIRISESHRFCDRVQDAYTLRCTPQVHGIAHDTIQFVRGIITTEMNSATDNPVSLIWNGIHSLFLKQY